MIIAKLDAKHGIEYEKDKPENRRKRLEDAWPLSYPFAIAIETSSNCNSNCIMCPRRDMSRPVGNMEMELFKKMVDELRENRVVLRKLFLHWMGEPLMNPEIAHMISYAQENKVAEVVVMGTNAIKLEGEVARDIVSSGLDEIFISMDANTPESYEAIKGHDIHFSIIEKNIREFVQLKRKMNSRNPYIRLKMLKSEINAHEVDDYITKWRDVVDEVYIEEDLNLWNGTNERVNAIMGSDKFVDACSAEGIDRFPCERLWYQMVIAWNGYASPCIADWNLSGMIGHVRQYSLFEIWNQPILVAMRRAHIEGMYDSIEMCSKCMRWINRKPGDWIFKKEKSLSICQK